MAAEMAMALATVVEDCSGRVRWKEVRGPGRNESHLDHVGLQMMQQLQLDGWLRRRVGAKEAERSGGPAASRPVSAWPFLRLATCGVVLCGVGCAPRPRLKTNVER